jgi:hypothetical protein
MREPNGENRHRHSGRMSVWAKIFMVIGILTVVYLFITEVLMRILAMLTVR